jgi:hypothetical protein
MRGGSSHLSNARNPNVDSRFGLQGLPSGIQVNNQPRVQTSEEVLTSRVETCCEEILYRALREMGGLPLVAAGLGCR